MASDGQGWLTEERPTGGAREARYVGSSVSGPVHEEVGVVDSGTTFLLCATSH